MIGVLHVIGNLRLGGGQKLTYMVVEGLSPERFSTSVCCLEEGGYYADLLKTKGHKVFEFGGQKDYSVKGVAHSLGLLGRMVHVIRTERPKIVHTHLFGAGIVGRLAARLCGVPVVVTTLHRIFYPGIQPIVENFLGRWTDAIVVDSEAVGTMVQRKCHIGSSKIKVIYNGIETKEFLQEYEVLEARKGIGLPDDVCDASIPLVGIVAHLLPHKGQKHFIEALALVREKGIPAHLLLVGGGPQFQELEAYSKALGLRDFVHFLGYREDLNLVLSALTLLALPSSWEGFGIILAEAMFKRLPVISTDHGGSRETVKQYETGLLVPFGDVERLADATRMILSYPDLARNMGERGRARVYGHFTKEKMLSQYEGLYDSLLEMKSIRCSKAGNPA